MDELEIGTTVDVLENEGISKEAEVEKVQAPESIEETIAKSIKEIKEAKGETDEPQEVAEEKPEVEARPEPQVKQKRQREDNFQPPSDWTAEAKEEFKKLPKIAQKEVVRIAQSFEKHRKQQINEFSEKERSLTSKEKELDSIRTTVARFLPVWGRQGLTAEAALSEICTFYADLLNDPDAALEDVARKVGRKIQIEGKKVQREADPLLQETLNRVQNVEKFVNSAKQTQQSYQNQQLAQSIDNAFVDLRDLENGAGKYMYPDLHDPEFVKREIEPLVLGLARANPNLSWDENIKRSYIAAGGRVIPKASSMTTRLNGNKVAAQRATASVSGVGSGSSDDGELPFIPGESVEDTIRRVKASLSSR